MAVDLVYKTSIIQTFVYDLESTFWLMIWVALLYLPSNWSPATHSSFIQGTMNPPVYGGSGGLGKIQYMQSDTLNGLKFDGNQVLGKLLSCLKKTLAVQHQEWPTSKSDNLNPVDLYAEHTKQSPLSSTSNAPQHDTLLAGLKDYWLILVSIYRHLLKPDWPEGDAAKPQPVLLANNMQATINSSPKRSRDVAEQNGVFNLALPVKWSELRLGAE
jgi:hypothetical protein